jgi:hypothetical protein
LSNDAVDYPVRFEVKRDASQSKLTNFPLGIAFFIRGLLLIPHLIILYFIQIVAAIVYFIATFAILFNGSYPAGMFKFYVGYTRWNANAYGYLASLYDKYPPFSMDPQDYPLTLEVDYPATLSKWLNFPLFIGLIIKFILLIPHLIVVALLYIAALVVVFIAQFAILFGGAFPEGMHTFVVGVNRWGTRVNAYAYGLTDKYPPFTTK